MAENYFTPLQRQFIEHYLQCWNGTEACRRAGYKGSDNVLAVQAHKNLRLPKIRQAIEERMREVAMGTDEVLARLSEQARADVSDFICFDSGVPALDLGRARERGKLHLVRELREDKDGALTVKMVDSQSALSQIAKILGMHQPVQVEHTLSPDVVAFMQARGIGFEDMVRAFENKVRGMMESEGAVH